MGSTVDGLVSGMDTTSIITSMMKIESQPKVVLQTKVSTATTAVGSYQSVNTRLAALKTAADDLGQLSTWRAIKPASSSPTVSVNATGGVNNQSGSLTFDVVSLAKAQASTARVASTGDITAADTIEISIGATNPVTHPVTLGANKTAQGVSDAINAAGIGVKASVVQTSSGDSVLQLTSSKGGAANSFSVVSGLDTVEFKTAVPATDARIQVGGADEDGGYGVTSATNTFTGLMNGVTVTVTKEEPNVTLSVAQDVSGIAAKFQALVDAANATLTEVTDQTRYDAEKKVGSPLTGDFMVRQLSQTILSKISQGLSYTDQDADGNPVEVKFGSLSKFGIQLDRTGKLSFDADKFTAAYNTDPTAIKKAGVAFADTFESMAGKQGDNITAAITSRKNFIDSMNVQIGNWDVRLSARQVALSKQYSDLETSLGKLKNQSTWLAGQLAGLG